MEGFSLKNNCRVAQMYRTTSVKKHHFVLKYNASLSQLVIAKYRIRTKTCNVTNRIN